MLYQHYIELTYRFVVSSCSQSIVRRSNNNKRKIIQSALEPVIDCAGAPPHKNKLNKRADGLPIDREIQSEQAFANRTVDQQESECQASILRDRSPLHKLNKSSTKFADKIRGNHSSRLNACISV